MLEKLKKPIKQAKIKNRDLDTHCIKITVLLAEKVGFEPTCPCGQLDFEFYHRLLITWFLLSVSVSLVRPQIRMKSGIFEKSPENTEESPIGSNQRFFRFWKELRKERKEQK